MGKVAPTSATALMYTFSPSEKRGDWVDLMSIEDISLVDICRTTGWSAAKVEAYAVVLRRTDAGKFTTAEALFVIAQEMRALTKRLEAIASDSND